jgi:hypothetical protein
MWNSQTFFLNSVVGIWYCFCEQVLFIHSLGDVAFSLFDFIEDALSR